MERQCAAGAKLFAILILKHEFFESYQLGGVALQVEGNSIRFSLTRILRIFLIARGNDLSSYLEMLKMQASEINVF